jgi:hypothetical protein
LENRRAEQVLSQWVCTSRWGRRWGKKWEGEYSTNTLYTCVYLLKLFQEWRRRIKENCGRGK